MGWAAATGNMNLATEEVALERFPDVLADAELNT